MRVKEFHIKNFRSILDSGVISADYYLNTFIGANESGKTSVLKALNNLSFTHDEDDICTFSESWENWQSNEINKEDIDLIDITFELDENDKKSFSKLHKELVTDTIKVNNCFEGLFQIEIDGINLDEISSKIFEERISKKINHIHKELNKLLKFFRNNDESFRNVENAITQIILVLEEYPNNVEDILERNFFLIKSNTNNDTTSDSVNSIISSVKPYIDDIEELNINGYHVFNDLMYYIPNFEYLSLVEELKNSYLYNDFILHRENYPTLDKLMKLVQWDEENYNSRNSTGKKLLLAHASKKFEKMFNDFWGQDDITFNIHIDDEISILVTDKLVEMPQKLSMRSEGLNGAISFFIHLMSIPENTIILLDDPGVHLHPSAQKDILNIIKKLSEDKQIFFTTHSPSMIDRNNLNGVKLVTKNGSVGTKIKGKFHASDYDIYEPIRAAIGMTLADSLFTTKKNLLVEGISDLFILEALSKFSEGENKEFIDTSKISIFPTNGAKKMSNYVPFLLKEELECVCIFDSDKEGKDAKNELISKFDVKKENIIILNDLFDEDITKDLTIEDLIDFDFYLKALNLAYKNIFVDKIGKNNMDIDDLVGESKSFKGIKKYFKDNGLNKPDKVLIAKKIFEIAIAKTDSPDVQTIKTFSKLFDKVNNLLLH